MKVGNKVLMLNGQHQHETGTVIDILDGNLIVIIDGWPGSYRVYPGDCIKIIAADQ
jgi:uncharacterized cupin superfamily protein